MAHIATGDRWIHEVKWDGYRFQVIKNGNTVRLFSRNGADWTSRLPKIAAAFFRIPTRVVQIDVEALKREALEALAMEYQPRHRWGEKPTDETE